MPRPLLQSPPMSADAESHPDLEAEREVDLGRAWRSLLSRWWLILAAVVVGVVVGYLVSLGSGNVYQAKATIYLGQPLSATGSAQLQSYQNNPSTVNQLARDPGLVKDVATQVGVLPGKLRAGISTKVVAGASTRTGQTPLVELIVRGPFRDKGADAANLIAESVVEQVSVLATAKVATLGRLQESQQRALTAIDQSLTALQQAQADTTLSSTDKLVLSTQALTAETRRAQIEDDLACLTRAFRVAQLLGSPMVLTGCGSYHPTRGYGPHPRNHSPEARERMVVFLKRAAPRAEEHGIVLALECHMITALDTPAHIREVVDAVASPALKVNFDPVNLLASIDAVYDSGAQMAAMLAELGPRYHWTAHAKDILIEARLALHFEETVCGDGLLDWPAYLRCAERLGTPERPAAVLVEHMPAFLAPRGLEFVRSQAAADGVQIVGRRR